jgi:NADPH-dependent 2,4-dienoyl-CoA reductase/sulfur reductase-like enzyme
MLRRSYLKDLGITYILNSRVKGYTPHNALACERFRFNVVAMAGWDKHHLHSQQCLILHPVSYDSSP